MSLNTPAVISRTSKVLSLAGQWNFALDPNGVGLDEAWYGKTLPDQARLPGDLTSQGIGNEVTAKTPWIGSVFDPSYYESDRFAEYREDGNVKVPFWLQPELYYSGASWFEKSFEVPESWLGKRIVLFLERTHWKTTVWLDGKEIGSNMSLSVPHVYELGLATNCESHRITIRVDNSLLIDLGENSHSISDHTQGNWNGIVGRLELQAMDPIWVEDLQLYPDAAKKDVKVRGTLKSIFEKRQEITLAAAVAPIGKSQPLEGKCEPCQIAISDEAVAFELVYRFDGDASLWDEFNPFLYEFSLELKELAASEVENYPVRFGFRKIEARDRQLYINGKKLFLRGTLECCIFPKTGHPPTEEEEWKKVYSTVKAHGLNHVRFHSWCPPEVAIRLADEMGVYIQIEAGSWPNQSVSLGDGDGVDGWIEAESNRILDCYGNHASFVLMASGNEPQGDNHEKWLQSWLRRRKKKDRRRLYTGASAWPLISGNDYHIHSEPRIQHWEEGLGSRINALPPETVSDYRVFIREQNVPTVSHEIGQWCVYPNFKEMSKYTGYLKPKNFEIFQKWLADKGMSHLADEFVMASGTLQALCYKEDIESALRTPEMGGFQLLDLHDFPGQGTALVGVLDPFWDSKAYISAEEYRRFASAITPLARFPKRVFQDGESVSIDLELAHYGEKTIEAAVPEWKMLNDEGEVVLAGTLPSRDLPPDGLLPLGIVSLDFKGLATPARYRFVLGIEGTTIENDWSIWLYSKDQESSKLGDPSMVSELDEETEARLNAGETVLLQLDPDRVKGDENGPVQLGFSTTFWNTSWTNEQAPHTMGVLCDPEHPALDGFPTGKYSDWQWWYVIKNAAAMNLDLLPESVNPIIRVVDDWFHVRRLALAFEVKVGKGRLILCSVDLGAKDNPVVTCLRKCLVEYINSEGPSDLLELSVEQIKSLCE
ncbi:glycoside hydrolase family 2 TIM barrel-domain containing protein [Pelagicoccus albus]|uniref:beta-galactosidase n=1 Tax=Pelagicoccus albus TaxID=415222 RepID=A0A7X1B915_9BACT|nr:glycoside hydrolase family 2 TIM barrel-domain containing protein [Pelagicoccus albus]MBC2606600.1 hypothetical protein [Pelagicoccus albus]